MYNIANCFARERTEKATTVIPKKRYFHHIKRRTLVVQRCFYFFNIIYMKKVLTVSKTIIICVYQTLKTFFI